MNFSTTFLFIEMHLYYEREIDRTSVINVDLTTCGVV